MRAAIRSQERQRMVANLVYNLGMAGISNRMLGFAILSLAGGYGRGQAPPAEPVVSIIPRSRPELPVNSRDVPDVHLRVDASLVLVPLHAATLLGTSVTNLQETNFRVYEDGVEQKISYFSKEDAPLSVGLVFDASGSMANKIRKSAEAAAAFFKTANRDDEFFLVEFGERPKLEMPFTSDSEQIYRKIAHSRPFGRTSLIDAIQLALTQMKKARNSRKAIVILSDGGDNRSRLTRGEIKDALTEADVQMFAIGIFNHGIQQTLEEINGPRLLADLALQTGGRVFAVDNIDQLDAISAQLGNALRNQYLLGYFPADTSRNGKYHQVKVSLVAPPGMPELSVSYRQGYYAPVE
jgi:Ca-activated chloride channel homolog